MHHNRYFTIQFLRHKQLTFFVYLFHNTQTYKQFLVDCVNFFFFLLQFLLEQEIQIHQVEPIYVYIHIDIKCTSLSPQQLYSNLVLFYITISINNLNECPKRSQFLKTLHYATSDIQLRNIIIVWMTRRREKLYNGVRMNILLCDSIFVVIKTQIVSYKKRVINNS